MDIFLRAIAILVEASILAAIIYALLNGVRLILFDLGIGAKYKKVVAMVLVMAGCIVVVFFVAHLTTFYPALSSG